MTAPDASALPLIGITMGDPLGIGPEVLVKALSDTTLRRRARFVVYGLHDVMEYAADQAEISQFWWREPYDRLPRVGTGVLVADFDHLRVPRANGEHGPDLVAGDVSFRFVDAAIEHLGRHDIDALVTGPICKASWSLAGQKFAGHTELLAKRFNTRRVTMAFIAGDMRVALASAHVPLFELRNQFTIGLVHQPIDLLDQALREWFGIARPHIGVLGLNPHAGEAGLLGDEELRVIEPAMTMARDSGIHVSGPLPADTAFIPENLRRYDGIVAMYHDQGLIPVKMRAFNAAVNVTLGLEALRTSPDHGTAFDIAGKNLADPGSMKAAIGLAIELAEQRRKARAAAAASAGASGAHPGM
jgi:4-hydroxythreonine-4-phosphate dehydrogenase